MMQVLLPMLPANVGIVTLRARKRIKQGVSFFFRTRKVTTVTSAALYPKPLERA
jgi:hypothetical protein